MQNKKEIPTDEQLKNYSFYSKFFPNKKFKAIAGVVFIFIIASIVIYLQKSGTYTNKVDVKKNQEQTGQDGDESLQNKNEVMKGNDKNLPKPNNATEDNYIDLVESCGYLNEYSEINDKIIDRLKENGNFNDYLAQGYKLQEACESDGNILLFLDFETGYWKNISKDWDELGKLAQKAIIGITDNSLSSIKLFPLSVSGYFFEGPGGAGCSFDKYIDNKILYFCYRAGDSGSMHGWYDYDIKANKNIKIKEVTTIFPDYKTDKAIFDEDILNLFSMKSILGECDAEPYVKQYEGLGANDKKSIAEYVVPINCEYSLLFKRQGSGQEYNEWDGIFDVYLKNDNGLVEKFFVHKGLLMDIAGGRYWDVEYYDRGFRIFLEFRDMRANAVWEYFISLNKEKIIEEADALNDWQTYQDKEYGYKVEYPKDLNLYIHPSSDYLQEVRIGEGENAGGKRYFSILVENNKENFTEDEYMENKEVESSAENMGYSSKIIKREDYETEYIKGRKFTIKTILRGYTDEYPVIIIKKDNVIFELYPLRDNYGYTGEQVEIADKILKSFRF